MPRLHPLRWLIPALALAGGSLMAHADPAADALRAAKEREAAGQFVEAIAAYQHILQANPDDVEARLGLGTSLAGAQRMDEAVRTFKEVLAQHPAQARAHLLLGDLYLYRQKQYDLALAEFEQVALTGDGPTQALAREQAGDILMMVKRDWAQAAERYRQVLAIWPNHIKTHYNLGGCLANQGELEAAVAEMELVVKLAPKAENPEMATRAQEAMASIRSKQAASRTTTP